MATTTEHDDRCELITAGPQGICLCKNRKRAREEERYPIIKDVVDAHYTHGRARDWVEKNLQVLIIDGEGRAMLERALGEVYAEPMWDVEIHFTLPAKSAEAARSWVNNALMTVLEDGLPVNHDWWMHEDNVQEVPHGRDHA